MWDMSGQGFMPFTFFVKLKCFMHSFRFLLSGCGNHGICSSWIHPNWAFDIQNWCMELWGLPLWAHHRSTSIGPKPPQERIKTLGLGKATPNELEEISTDIGPKAWMEWFHQVIPKAGRYCQPVLDQTWKVTPKDERGVGDGEPDCWSITRNRQFSTTYKSLDVHGNLWGN